MDPINYERYSKEYDQDKLVEKIKKNAIKGGKKLIYAVLLLYYTLQKENVPVKAKAVIIGALGYFITPFDFIPDLLPIMGYTDDFGALMMAVATVSMYIDHEVKEKARQQLITWFGEVDDQDLGEVNDKL